MHVAHDEECKFIDIYMSLITVSYNFGFNCFLIALKLMCCSQSKESSTYYDKLHVIYPEALLCVWP